MICKVEGCDRIVAYKKLCDAHYQRWKRTGDVMADVPINLRVRNCRRHPVGLKCKSPVCNRPVYSKGLCESHYKRQLRTGDAKINEAVGEPTWEREK